MIPSIHALAAACALTLLTTTVPAQAQGKNLLFYGNSYTYYSWGYGVSELVQAIAIEAGHPAPTCVSAHVGGSTLQFHSTDPTQIAYIGNALPGNATWDHVIMQGRSLEATPEGGYDPALFRAAAVTIMGNVLSHSPAARGVLYQTWASAFGHSYYPIPWSGPAAMHDVIRTNYRLAATDIETTHGAGAAAVAAVGDGMALLEWDPMWYESDLAHPSPHMILLAAMVLYTAIYEQPICPIEPTFAPTGALANVLALENLGPADWRHMAGIADLCADPAVRPFAGSGEQLLLETNAGPGPVTACGGHTMTNGTLVQLQVRSLNGAYDNAPTWLLIDLFPTGTPPGPAATYPEIRVDLGSMGILTTAPDLGNPLTFVIPMPLTLPGSSVLVQGLAWGPSGQTGNQWFTTTDAHEFVFF